MRWRVRFLTERPNWTYYGGTAFVDAPTEAQARAMVEVARTRDGDTTARAWEAAPATDEMEAAHADRVRRRAEWIRRVKAGENPRGLL